MPEPLIGPEHILARNHGDNPMMITHPDFSLLAPMSEFLLTELHFNSNGATDDTPSLCFVLDKWQPDTHTGMRVYTQVSLNRFNHALHQLGYRIDRNKITQKPADTRPLYQQVKEYLLTTWSPLCVKKEDLAFDTLEADNGNRYVRLRTGYLDLYIKDRQVFHGYISSLEEFKLIFDRVL